MPLNVPAGATCFIDANILYYAYVETPPASELCRHLLRRGQARELSLCCDTRSVTDAVHKSMLAEVCHSHNVTRASLVGWLKQNPAALAQLPNTADIASKIMRLRLTVIASGRSVLSEAIAISQQHQLLLNDAIIIASMRRHKITHLASNDDDFDRVSGITLWKPRP